MAVALKPTDRTRARLDLQLAADNWKVEDHKHRVANREFRIASRHGITDHVQFGEAMTPGSSSPTSSTCSHGGAGS